MSGRSKFDFLYGGFHFCLIQFVPLWSTGRHTGMRIFKSYHLCALCRILYEYSILAEERLFTDLSLSLLVEIQKFKLLHYYAKFAELTLMHFKLQCYFLLFNLYWRASGNGLNFCVFFSFSYESKKKIKHSINITLFF